MILPNRPLEQRDELLRSCVEAKTKWPARASASSTAFAAPIRSLVLVPRKSSSTTTSVLAPSALGSSSAFAPSSSA